MPAGTENPILGPVAFLAIKVVGYTAAAVAISKAYGRKDLNPFVVGAARTAIGLVFGVLAVLLLGLIGKAGGAIFLIGLIPIRIVEWWLLIWTFYDRQLANRRLGWKVAILGTVWSFILDIPSIAGLIIVGGFWIC
jgi:hypothetical protein